jgi:hypothetical protein
MPDIGRQRRTASPPVRHVQVANAFSAGSTDSVGRNLVGERTQGQFVKLASDCVLGRMLKTLPATGKRCWWGAWR